MAYRRSNPAADKAAKNQSALRNLLKIETNKVCADCKRNKHPRWASWNIGIFICIRCSGIHRSMGTHISRVKSVDLDTWNDEQLASVVRWGNARANKYWEAKLANGHIPSEAKIENFIRTKYELKRWVMDGPMPDPSTLVEGEDDDVPLAVVQEKAKLERANSQRSKAPPSYPRPTQVQGSLVDDDPPVSPTPPTTTPAIPTPQPAPAPAPTPSPAQVKPQKTGDSLLGLDFFGPPPSGSRSATATPGSTSSGPSRPDLKQSILSLYASPKPTASSPPPAQSAAFGSFSSLTSSPPPAPKQRNDSFGGLVDAFSGLSFPSTTPPASNPAHAHKESFSSGGSINSLNPSKSPPAPAILSPPLPLTGGNFFSHPTPVSSAPKPTPKHQSKHSVTLSFDDEFSTFQSAPASPAPPAPAAAPSSAFDLLGELSSPQPATSAAPPAAPASSAANDMKDLDSIFNLSSPPVNPKATPPPAPAMGSSTTTSTAAVTSALPSSAIDPWGSGNAWSAPDPEPEPVPAKQPSTASLMKVPDTLTPNDIGSGWGLPSGPTAKETPTIAPDEDFGGWTSAPVAADPIPKATTAAASLASDDLFSNVWQ